MIKSLSSVPPLPFAPVDHRPVNVGRVGVLLVNLGTPDNTDFWSVRRYLKEFLSDPRVIELPKIRWWFILNGIVLTRRPTKSGEAYKSIWNNELDESPLRTFTRTQAGKLSDILVEISDNLVADWAMRYGNPSISETICRMKSQGCDRILVFPLYPQYSATSTATANDKVFECLQKMRYQPTLRIVPPFHDNPVYVDALAQSIDTHLSDLGWEPEIVLASYHGIPQSYFEKGDPYYCHCQKTTRLLRERLGWTTDKLQITFQSRFGKEDWLQPYTDETVSRLANDGIKKIAIIAPGFFSDCLETLEEIAGEICEIFHEGGGEKFTYIPCLNDSDLGMDVIRNCIEQELQGWV